ncbi:MAG: helix-turn-helix domain-containing protein [Peptococcaceae bacterium]|nr:helix-turn-helix domain-containing protein [Peptococcaceae bacterium]
MRNIGERLRVIREQRNMTQAQLAKRVGVSRSHIAKIENNDTDGSVAVLTKIATVLDVSIAVLLDEPQAKVAAGN